MPRASADRPSRRLEAILGTLRRHGVRAFRAKELPGIGSGLEFEFGDAPAVTEPAEAPARSPGHLSHPERTPRGPIDELDLVAEGRDGPLDADETVQ